MPSPKIPEQHSSSAVLVCRYRMARTPSSRSRWVYSSPDRPRPESQSVSDCVRVGPIRPRVPYKVARRARQLMQLLLTIPAPLLLPSSWNLCRLNNRVWEWLSRGDTDLSHDCLRVQNRTSSDHGTQLAVSMVGNGKHGRRESKVVSAWSW